MSPELLFLEQLLLLLYPVCFLLLFFLFLDDPLLLLLELEQVLPFLGFLLVLLEHLHYPLAQLKQDRLFELRSFEDQTLHFLFDFFELVFVEAVLVQHSDRQSLLGVVLRVLEQQFDHELLLVFPVLGPVSFFLFLIQQVHKWRFFQGYLELAQLPLIGRDDYFYAVLVNRQDRAQFFVNDLQLLRRPDGGFLLLLELFVLVDYY